MPWWKLVSHAAAAAVDWQFSGPQGPHPLPRLRFDRFVLASERFLSRPRSVGSGRAALSVPWASRSHREELLLLVILKQRTLWCHQGHRWIRAHMCLKIGYIIEIPWMFTEENDEQPILTFGGPRFQTILYDPVSEAFHTLLNHPRTQSHNYCLFLWLWNLILKVFQNIYYIILSGIVHPQKRANTYIIFHWHCHFQRVTTYLEGF